MGELVVLKCHSIKCNLYKNANSSQLSVEFMWTRDLYKMKIEMGSQFPYLWTLSPVNYWMSTSSMTYKTPSFVIHTCIASLPNEFVRFLGLRKTGKPFARVFILVRLISMNELFDIASGLKWNRTYSPILHICKG